MRGHTRTDGLLEDYCDGSDFKQHPLFSKQSKSLQIMLYYDELEVCNPLGSKVKTHKLGKNIMHSKYCKGKKFEAKYILLQKFKTRSTYIIKIKWM